MASRKPSAATTIALEAVQMPSAPIVTTRSGARMLMLASPAPEHFQITAVSGLL